MPGSWSDFLKLRSGPAPPPSSEAGAVRVYADAGGALRSVQSDGTDAPIGGGGGSMPDLTSPLDIENCALWLDASQLEGLNDNDPVALWPDRSTKGYDASQADPDLRPIYKTAVQNGLPVVRFDPGAEGAFDHGLSLSGDGLDLFRAVDGCSVVFVAHGFGQDNSGDALVLASAGDSADNIRVRAKVALYAPGLDIDGAIGGNNLEGNPSTQDEQLAPHMGLGQGPVVFIGSIDFANGQVQLVHSQGVGRPPGPATLGPGFNDTPGPTPDTASVAITIGGGFWTGDICELAVYQRALNLGERRRLMEYLSAKWATL